MSQTETEQSDDAVADLSATVALTPAELPGRRLREAREARGLSLADAANALKFSPRQIAALEADDFHGLQGATFVRGFIRSYARFLKQAPEPLLAMLDAGTALPTAEVRAPEDTGAAMPQPGERRLSAWVAGAIVLVVIAASLIAWHLVSPESAPSLPRELPLAKTERPAQPAEKPVVQPPAPRIEAAPADAAGNQSVAPPAATVIPPDMRQLILTFSDKSWVEIKDSSQRVILSGEFSAGDRQVANGKPPFQLWVGRASAVRVQDGDREVDLKPHARDEVARLTVD
ncbi:helix-turn-helix domain-containing protein [Sulfurisoma sediminicola]|uniref:Cytoskeleton protein RodZ n=1 Tax=Sulfurisoma sediminicola TaxID=1381557 RepID=A0A497X9I3_9PROT|nr:RodZ domain-containing protein [Sulfurisoma sediminicola]RLJ62879.1 cytoskeleton protein RodZ [Sulfurisoma sediminicola]